MRVAITGNRRLAAGDVVTVARRVAALVLDPAVEEVVFGGAAGADTEALRSALVARRGPRPRLTVVVPGTLADQPAETQATASGGPGRPNWAKSLRKAGLGARTMGRKG